MRAVEQLTFCRGVGSTMKIYDCSRTIKEGMTLYPGDRPPKLIWIRTPNERWSISQTEIEMGMHNGTHIDTPLHFIPGGKTLDDVPLDRFIGPCRLIEVDNKKGAITVDDIAPHGPKEGEILLFKTANSSASEDASFSADYVTFDRSAAQYLAECGVKTVGLDYLSVDNAKNFGNHDILLGAGICLIESLYFRDVPPGRYFLSALPLKVAGAEASPVRAVLVDFDVR